ncbi:MAG TPA: alpha/beta hydrolase [Gemmatimonadaceae bacterium]
MIYLLSLVALGIVVYFGLLGTLWLLQENVVFQPPRSIAASDVGGRRVTYRTSDGVELFAYVVGECTSSNTLMLAFHGNADLARWFVPWAVEVVKQTSACVMIPEYRGYDGAGGKPTYAASALDARAALDCARASLGADNSRLVYFGHSLGTAIATELARVQPPRSLILQSPFTSARAMARRMFLPGLTLFWTAISRVHFDTIVAVRALRCPVWVSHGSRDIIIPVKMGRDVYDSAAVKGEVLIVDTAGHNDVPEVGGEAYWKWLEAATFSTVEATRAAARAETQ